MRWNWRPLAAWLLALCLLAGCAAPAVEVPAAPPPASAEADGQNEPAPQRPAAEEPAGPSEPEEEAAPAVPTGGTEVPLLQAGGESFSLEDVPAWTGEEAYTAVHGNVPYFTEDELTDESFETYAPLDGLGRCGTAFACVGQDVMPTEDRESISSVKPSGWQTAEYDFVDGGYLYNRCHLIGFQLTGENANEQNLITGTRYLNIEGMLPFENLAADYVQETGNHVLYRVTPVFQGDELVARGVLMEGWSVEDGGDGVCFCVYAWNVQPGVAIDYATGASAPDGQQPAGSEAPAADAGRDYVVNTNSGKFHNPDCSSVDDILPENRKDVHSTREQLIAQGYDPCGRGDP